MTSVFDLVIAGGKLVTSNDTFMGDIGIMGEKIAAIGIDLPGKQVVDASEKFVIPGGVDPHVHLEMPQGDHVSSDDFESGTIAAACGGTTTFIDFVEPEGDQKLLEALEIRRSMSDGRSVIDYGFHMTLSDGRTSTLDQVPGIVRAGCPSFKLYTIYEGFYLEDGAMLDVMEVVRSAGGMVLVHAENRHIVKHLQDKYLAAGKIQPCYHPLSRPPIVEDEAIRRVLALTEVSGCPIYIVHISTHLGVDAVRHARSRGLTVFGETCPQYLLLNESCYDLPGFESARFVCSPPLRPPENQHILWGGLNAKQLDTVGTDHCPFYYEDQKIRDYKDFTQIPNGLPGIEARLALVYSFGVGSGHLSLNRWIEVCSTTPARIFGLYPDKGSLEPGADADIVVFDPGKEVTLSQQFLHERVDYTPYEGTELSGYPVMTIARGQVICRDGGYIGQSGRGRFFHRIPFSPL